MNPEPSGNPKDPQDPLVLNYGGALVEGGGHWREEVDALLAKSSTSEEMRAYFHKPSVAVMFYAQAMEERHAGDRDEPCRFCRSNDAPRRVTVEWIARLDPKVDLCSGQADFKTVYRLCEACAARTQERLTRDRSGELISRIGVFVLGVLTAVGLWKSASDAVTVVSLGLSWIVLMVFGVIFSEGSRHRWEKDFGPLMPGGVQYVGVVRVDSGCDEGQCCE